MTHSHSTMNMKAADSIGRTSKGVGLRPLARWDCGYESRRMHRCLSLVTVVL